MSNLDKIKKLRSDTGVSLAECKKAIEESGGDTDAAREILRKKGRDMAAKKSGREAGEGRISSYIHDNGRIGVLLDLRCESDFVSKSDEFADLSRELCLQIAAMGPSFVKEEDIPLEELDKERKILEEQYSKSGKPKDVVDKILEGKIEGYKKESCLLMQPWIKDNERRVVDLINEYIAKIGENIVVNRFTRYEL